MQKSYDFSLFDPSITSKKISLITNQESFHSKTPGKIYLLIDSDKRIRGIDTFVSCSFDQERNKKVVKYVSYDKNNKGKVFDIGLSDMFSKYSVFEVNDLDFAHKYSDESLRSQVITWEQGETFQYLYGEEAGKNLYSAIMKLVNTDISFRINFLDLTAKHKHILHLLCFDDSREDVSDKAKQKIKEDITILLK